MSDNQLAVSQDTFIRCMAKASLEGKFYLTFEKGFDSNTFTPENLNMNNFSIDIPNVNPNYSQYPICQISYTHIAFDIRKNNDIYDIFTQIIETNPKFNEIWDELTLFQYDDYFDSLDSIVNTYHSNINMFFKCAQIYNTKYPK